jgi:site-specific recombinase XerD
LLAQGYTWQSAARLIHLMAHLSRWLDDEALDAGKLTPSAVERFVEARRADGYVGWRSAHALSPLLEYLRARGVVPAPEPALVATALERMLERYAAYLVHERGLAAASVRNYLRVGRRFLEPLADDDQLRLGEVDAATVIGFVARECPRRGVASAKATVTGLRSLLRFLYLDSETSTLLAPAVPSVACWQLTGLPRAVASSQLARLLRSCDRRTALGKRDFAIVTVLARLGLRAGEVAGLTLDDVEWRRGEIVVCRKGGRHERLPLPVDVGEALVAWLRRGRASGAVACRSVFTRMRAPHGPLGTSAVSAVVRRACRRAGIPVFGAHRLRHTAATEMLQGGASLPEVGRVLGHRRLVTSAIYAKVDQVALSKVAEPWPGVEA